MSLPKQKLFTKCKYYMAFLQKEIALIFIKYIKDLITRTGEETAFRTT